MEVTHDLINQKKVFLRKEPYYTRTIHRYYLTIIPQARFSKKELEIIDLSITKLWNHNATSIAKYARNDPPFIMANLGDEIDHRYVFSRKEEYSMMKVKLQNK